jgi:hypothetical protein
VDDRTFDFGNLSWLWSGNGNEMGARPPPGGRADIDDVDNTDHVVFARLAAEKGEMEACGFEAFVEATNRVWRD